MRNKNILTINNQIYYTKYLFQKNYKEPNSFYYSTSSNMAVTSTKPGKIKYIFNIVKGKNKKITDNKTPDNKYEIQIKQYKKNKYNISKTYIDLNHISSSNNKSNYIKKMNSNNINNSLKKNNKKKNYISIKKGYSSNNNENVKVFRNLSKNKVIKNISNSKNKIKGLNSNVSLNDSEACITNKKTIFQNNKINEFVKKNLLPKNFKNKVNNYSHSFIHRNNNNYLIINERKNETENEKQNIFSTIKNINNLNQKDKLQSSKNLNNFQKQKILKVNNKINDHKIKKVYTNNNTISFPKISKNNEDYVKLSKSIKLIKNKNISSKPTIFSSYSTSEKNVISTLVSNEATKENKFNKNNINELPFKDNFILNYTIESNGKDTQEYESKFLNYELGVSDKISTLNYTLDNNNQNNENTKNEYEKTVEEIERIANQIINNSNYKNKKISHFNNNRISKDITTLDNDDIEELKQGECIQKVLNLYISHNNNKK